MSASFIFICRHLGSFIFPVPVRAINIAEARSILEHANSLVKQQIRPTYAFAVREQYAQDIAGTFLDGWIGSVPFQTFDEGLENWMQLEQMGPLNKHAHHLVQLERVRAGEIVRSRSRHGSVHTVTEWTEQSLLDLIATEAEMLEVPTPAQVFSEAVEYTFDFKTARQKQLDRYCASVREMHARFLLPGA